MEAIRRSDVVPSLPFIQLRDVIHGRAVLEQEIKGLRALADSLGSEFAEVVDCLSSIQGRVILSGMGKSGIIARKIAATLSSTGTPAHFVHPGEASHGDLGMITQADAVLVLSNSGETPELSDLIGYCKRFGIPLIAMVRRRASTLVNAADLSMVLPEVSEASPTNAPTTSTTMMLALGDAIAVALLERKGFTREDFSIYHPGGKLGKALIRVNELMHDGDRLPLVTAESPMRDVLLIMTAKTFGCAGVVCGQGTLLGIITDGDLRRHMQPSLLDRTAGEVMTACPVTIRPGALAAEALGIMNSRSITSLFVVEGDEPIGILHIHDCLRAGIA